MDLYFDFVRTDVIDFIVLLGAYCLICVLNFFLKIRCFCLERINETLINNNKPFEINKIFWILFKFDFITFQIPIVLLVFTNYIWKAYIWIGLVFFVLLLSFLQKSIAIKESFFVSKNIPTIDLDTKIIRLSVHIFRTLLFFITSACILAVDFPYFLMEKAKTSKFGVSLMDIGVGYFILCHSMRLIRNMNNETESKILSLANICLNIYNAFKKSSILFVLGLIRFISLSFLGYSVNVNEYGVHWNFFFTIFFVKVLSSIFYIFIQNSAKRAFILSILIGSLYQWLLTYKTDYILQYDQERKTFIDKNKEGLFSTIGYTSMFFMGESVCYHLKQVLNNQESSGRFLRSISIRCCVYLLSYSMLFFILTHLTSFYIQDISRRLCNLSFILHTLTTACFLWSFFVFGNIVAIQLLKKLVKRRENISQFEMDNILNHVLDVTHSFFRFSDSKFVGLAIFLIANLFTGLVNITITPAFCSYSTTLIILSINLLISSILPFSVYYFKNKDKN